ncbi:MAG: cysteine--tRNA ligase [Verrucomicrobiota bacterium]|jgi:cysteinyl-tRNA synthetase|nr:cysteine--tRNA ligase [Verrucomicrobiota bacterium]MDP6252075.1 cysteine--tRNA ligase [Verrucomicrobiota bacterium]MDP7177845.1 cysteine--tRNA ligase [Verrucomicrobiota bacterium]MDP7292870.1 cysteine--tRNA ligase [Verrucomicrobiota bacterium]MDP7441182.1 cysteine--tRNA ligase [Verrucomicrobiota bacterium]|tara:strand:- start:451 stop:1869 length:1419 start_codon:yes stop_codon:yes gene_type:complete
MGLRVFNTLSRLVEPFEPLDPAGKKVGLYCCGPTVHDFAHIGNFRTFVFADIVRRHLAFRGFDVCHVMNITDVEDKIIRRVNESAKTLAEFTDEHEQAFLTDLEALGCLMPDERPHATKFIGPIINLIKKLKENGIAYHANDGSVYFSIEKYREAGNRYGQLLNLNLEAMRPGERVSSDEYEKESIADFALWKARVPEDGEVFWGSPWGEGRPGWHIECSAMSMELLGPSFDLHLGGEDLVFPHHEDEIAQSEGACLQCDGLRFVKYWMHGAHLLVEGKKMSKSLGNFFTLRDLLAKGSTGREVRYLMISAHYRETFNFTLDNLAGAKTALGRIDECTTKLRELALGQAAEPATDSPLVTHFTEAMDDDLNVSAAWAAVFDWVRDTNRKLAANELDTPAAATELANWEHINSVLGIESVEEEVPAEIVALAEERQAARKAKDFARSDQIRDELAAQGWTIEDTLKGPRVKRT